MVWNTARRVWNGRVKTVRKSWRRKKIPYRALPRTVAKKRYDWQTLYNDIGPFGEGEGYCVSRCVEFGASYCEEPSLKIPIMPAGALQQAFDDDITIAKMVGWINWCPSWRALPACATLDTLDQQSAHQWPIYFRAGLYKQDVPLAQQGQPTVINPIASTDWSDERPLREWNHIWQPVGSRSVQIFQPGYPIGVCGDTTRAQYNTPATSSGSQPLFSVPAIETDCDIYYQGAEECIPAVIESTYQKPRYWKMSLNRRKPIRLRENDDLSIFANWSMPRPDAGAGPNCEDVCEEFNDGENPCKMRFIMVLKLLIQYG